MNEEMIEKAINLSKSYTDNYYTDKFQQEAFRLKNELEQEKEKNKKLEEERLTGIQLKCMQDEAYIKARADFERDYKESSQLYEKVIDMMVEDIYYTPDNWLCKTMKIKEDCYADTIEDNSACKECIKQYYFKKARGEE